MIVLCEECGKKYRVNEKMIEGESADCKCLSCGNIITVLKPQPQPPTDSLSLDPPDVFPEPPAGGASDHAGPEKGATFDREPGAKQKPSRPSKKPAQRRKGISITAMLLVNFLVFAIILGSLLTFVYLKYVPALLRDQVNLRTASISQALSMAVSQPLLLRNYLRINKTAETISRLPGVAYVSVLNKKGIVVAGIFGDVQRFSPDFAAMVKRKGFPRDLAGMNPLGPGAKESAKDLVVGGRKIHDVAVPIGETGGMAHVGLFTEDVEKAVNRSLKPLLVILAAVVVLGGISFMLLARTISIPIRSLTDAAQRISLGELDLPIHINKGGEIGELATSLERMRFSIKSALDRLRRR